MVAVSISSASLKFFEAILVPSAVTRGKNLDVFPDRLLEGSYLKVVNRNRLLPER